MKSVSLTTKDDNGNTINMWTNDPITPVTYEGVEYTNDTKEYRLAKFKAEVGNYWELDDILFKYVFCETFLMIDNWAKNSFASKMGGSKWIDLPYDFDTGLGTNNEGALVFSPFLEDIDQFENADVYNGQDSTLWRNLRDTYYPRISSMYNDLRGTGRFSYDVIAQRFTEHQSKWSENIYNEDALFKYIQPLIDEGNTAYLDMLQGSKAEQRKYWLYNRFKYLDSKYIAGDSASDVITLRGYAKTDIGVTPFQPIYVAIKYANAMVHKRGQANVETILECPLELVNDTETYIYSASQIKAITDLTNYKVGYADFSKAVRLQNLIVHKGSNNNKNTNLTNLALGNNRLLQTLECTYTPNLTQNINLVGCIGLQSVDFTGSAISGVTFANGTAVKNITLPNTITNLTLRNAHNIEHLNIGDNTDYSNITTFWAENSAYITEDYTLVKDILSDMPDNSRVRLVGIDFNIDSLTEVESFFALLDKQAGLDEFGNNINKAQVSGTIHVPIIGENRKSYYKTLYPYIDIVSTNISSGYTVHFMDYNGDPIITDLVAKGDDATYFGDLPIRNDDIDGNIRMVYEFIGWGAYEGSDTVVNNILEDIQSEKYVYAVYQPTTKYKVIFKDYDNTKVLFESWVESGTTAVYEPDESTLQRSLARETTGDYNYIFSGWSDQAGSGTAVNGILNNITASKTVYAAYDKLLVYEIENGYHPLMKIPNTDTSRMSGNVSNPKNVFDNNSSTNCSVNNGNLDIIYNFDKPCKITKISTYGWIYYGRYSDYTNRYITLFGSMDGQTNWVQVASFDNGQWNNNINNTNYISNNNNKYLYWLIRVNCGPQYIGGIVTPTSGLNELRLYTDLCTLGDYAQEVNVNTENL